MARISKTSSEGITEDIDLRGKTAIVTGASSGIGEELTRILALRGAKVIMACRNTLKANERIEHLRTRLEEDAIARLAVEECELSSMLSVRDFCQRLSQQGTKVDFLFMNGGVFGIPYRLTADKLEYTYAANYLGHFLMFRLLLDHGMLSGEGRVVATISDGAYKNPLSNADLAMLSKPTKASTWQRFLSRIQASPNSKVMLLLAMQHFAENHATGKYSGLRFNGADPGPTLTDNVNQLGFFLRLLAPIYSPFIMHSVERGAANILWLALADESAEFQAQLINPRFKTVDLPERCKSNGLARKVWQVSDELLANFLQPLQSAAI